MSTLIYLDNAATTKPSVAVLAAMTASLEQAYFNPSSIYGVGLAVRKAVDACRKEIKSRLSAHQVVFTSGGTEANNLAILGAAAGFKPGGRILYSAVEHSAVAQACKSLSGQFDLMAMPVHSDGLLDLDAAKDLMTPDTRLICLMQVNNEVGAIQPIEDLINLRNRLSPQAHFHVDGVQGFLRLPISLRTGIDTYALSAHKIHGPKGIGALALGQGAKILPRQLGGSQENGLRPGTENAPGIAGLMAAITTWPDQAHVRALKIKLYQELSRYLPAIILNGPDPALPLAADHILNLSFPPVKGQTLMQALEGEGVLVSQGSACSSRSKQKSASLQAMGLSQARQESALRFSFSSDNTMEEIDTAAGAVVRAYTHLSAYTRR